VPHDEVLKLRLNAIEPRRGLGLGARLAAS
jgi:hypothetical protein